MTIVNFVAQMGIWPNDYARQLEFFNRLKSLLQTANNFVIDNAGLVVLLEQATEPTQTQWETAWTTQTGLSLPIPPSAQLHWWNSSADVFGGLYGTVEGNTAVYRRDHIHPRGAVVAVDQAYKVDALSGWTQSIGTRLSDLPSLEIEIPTICDVELSFGLYVHLASGSGTWGVDFLWNGVKVGTQYLGIAVNQGIHGASAAGFLFARHVLSDVQPGTYEVQALFGVTASPASPPSLTIGGPSGASAYGARQLTVKAYAK
ncbi:hypothetical protein Rctr85_101 [Virus Rctr85]|nr:hypothetical protein Rctr85_101 [Virus Rctr85]